MNFEEQKQSVGQQKNGCDEFYNWFFVEVKFCLNPWAYKDKDTLMTAGAGCHQMDDTAIAHSLSPSTEVEVEVNFLTLMLLGH